MPKTISCRRWETSEAAAVSRYASVNQPSTTKAAGVKSKRTTTMVQTATRKYRSRLLPTMGIGAGGALTSPEAGSTDGPVLTPY